MVKRSGSPSSNESHFVENPARCTNTLYKSHGNESPIYWPALAHYHLRRPISCWSSLQYLGAPVVFGKNNSHQHRLSKGFQFASLQPCYRVTAASDYHPTKIHSCWLQAFTVHSHNWDLSMKKSTQFDVCCGFDRHNGGREKCKQHRHKNRSFTIVNKIFELKYTLMTTVETLLYI